MITKWSRSWSRSLARGFNWSNLTGRNVVFKKSGRLGEVVTHRGSTVFRSFGHRRCYEYFQDSFKGEHFTFFTADDVRCRQAQISL